MKLFVAVLSALLATACAEDDLFKGKSVVALNKAAFDKLDKSKAYFIKFYAPWCGHCQRLAPTWEELGEKFAKDDRIAVAKVDCTEEPDVCTSHNIEGYPTLLFFKDHEQDGEKYRGSRELEALNSFIQERIGDKEPAPKPRALYELTGSNFDEHIKEGNHFIKFFAPWCGHCKNLAPTWEELAEKYADSSAVKIGKVDCTEHKDICTKFEIRGYPTLLFLKNGGATKKQYAGSRSLENFVTFVDENSKAEDSQVEDNEIPESDAVPLLLTEDNFDSTIASGVTFVKFFAPWCGHCRNLAPTWTDLARKVTSAKIAKVDCTEQDTLCSRKDIAGYPSLILFKNGKQVEEYNGSRDLDDLKDFVERHAKELKDEL